MFANILRESVFSKVANTALAVALALSTGLASGAATIIINNINAAGVGFNDPTPAAPIGGNSGTTIGAQRLNAFTFAANIWGATLTSAVPIIINAQFSALACTATGATLGSAGATTVFRDFTGAIQTGTWYSQALANKLFGAPLNGTSADINANFNVNLGQPGCLTGTFWYYGFDNNHGPSIDFVTVLLHEMGHGIGFQTFTSGTTGNFQAGFPSAWDVFIRDDSTGLNWRTMTAAERVASAINTGNLVWQGPNVTANSGSVLSFGVPQLQVTAPASIASTYLAGQAAFGPLLTTAGVTQQVMPAGSTTTDMLACTPFSGLNALAVNGKIALVDRGTCSFKTKTLNAQNAGAAGVILANNVAGSPPPGLGDDATITTPITIPTISVTQADGNTLKSALLTRSRKASALVATIGLNPSQLAGADTAGRVMLYAPNPFISGSSVSHYDVSAFPNLLMEPNINGDLTHIVIPPIDLTFTLLQDTGW